MAALSKTQIDRLGDRLRKGAPSENDLQQLEEYRRSFSDAHHAVVHAIREKLNLNPTGRPEKSTTSIIDKLRRESIRLSQIQDIAGCRIVVTDIEEQDRVVVSLQALFPGTSITDRRRFPTHGYRAIHIIAKISGLSIEIQVRTVLQHTWAEFSERLSDRIDLSIKYGGGDNQMREVLLRYSKIVEEFEVSERKMAALPPQSLKRKMIQQGMNEQKQAISEALRRLIFMAK
jgi:ppGpp synthetase/RelA/SpoT-type nucleotidyltranferase